MPIGSTPASEGVSYGQLLVSHTNGVQFLVTLAPAQSPSEIDGDEAFQDMTNYLTAWPDRDTMLSVETTKTEFQTYAITPDEE